MKTRIYIEEITIADLVRLISTATDGSGWFGLWIPAISRASVAASIGIREQDCREDIAAKALLNGDAILLIDQNADGEMYADRDCKIFDEADGSIAYTIRLADIMGGLAEAFNGDFNSSCEEEIAHAALAAIHLRDGSGEFDRTEAEILAQIIMFNEIIY